ncbi:MAG: alpha/beta hydrolase [Clostridium sp.]|nr:alpha/beta hydrolase [Clostridium sp.]
MAYYKFNGKNIYFEEYGEGKPLIVLNGIMMSTKSWDMFIEPFSQDNRLILVDFLDQGRSDKVKEKYDQNTQVEVIKGLLDFLEIDKISILGISYGGEVALNFATKYEDRIDRLVLFNTSHRTSPWLKDIGDAWNLSANDPMNYYLTTIPVIYSPKFYNDNRTWVENRKKLLTENVFNNKDFMDSMVRLTISAEDHDLTEQVKNITTKTLIVSSENDYITPKEEQQMLHGYMKNSEYIIIPESGHASMYEKPALFITLTLGFVNSSQLDINII